MLLGFLLIGIAGLSGFYGLMMLVGKVNLKIPAGVSVERQRKLYFRMGLSMFIVTLGAIICSILALTTPIEAYLIAIIFIIITGIYFVVSKLVLKNV